jgi:hypothetical protein
VISSDVEKLQSGAVDLHGAGCQFSLLDQVKKKLPHLLGTEPLRRLAEELGELLHRVPIPLDGEVRIVAELQLIEHSLP